MKWLIWSNQHGAWWRPRMRGYTRVIEEAGRYERAQAEGIVADATLGGQLTHRLTDPVTGEQIQFVDEVMVLAPESAEAGESHD